MYRGDFANDGQNLTPRSQSGRAGDHNNNFMNQGREVNGKNTDERLFRKPSMTTRNDWRQAPPTTPSTGPIVQHRNHYYNQQVDARNPLNNGSHNSSPYNPPHNANLRSPYHPATDQFGRPRAVTTPASGAALDPNTIIKTLFADKGISLDHSKKLGSGRYSKVITAQTYTGATIAIKMINKSKVTADFRNKFLPRELECWKLLEHRNIVRLCSYYESKLIGYVFLVMEYGSGGDMLSHVQKNGPVPERQAQRWIYEICSAVSYMHGKDIAHRDLKLENIVIFGASVKIADFGFSRQVKNEFSHTFCGSKSYSAPEILMGQPYNAFKADVWSVGVVAFVICTDTMPYRENMSNPKIVEVQKNRQYRFPRTVPISPECKATIDRILTFEPHKRCAMSEALTLPWVAAGRSSIDSDGKNSYHHPTSAQVQTPRRSARLMMANTGTPQYNNQNLQRPPPSHAERTPKERKYETYYAGVRDNITKTRAPVYEQNELDDQHY